MVATFWRASVMIWWCFFWCILCVSTRAEIEPKEPLGPVAAPFDSKLLPSEDIEVKYAKMSRPEVSGGASGTFMHGFAATLSMIIVSELGDKTFFIAAIMAMRHSRLVVFLGAMTSLGMMHMLSALFGYATTIIPRVYTYYLSSLLFAIFGLKMLKEGCKMSANEAQEEFDEVQEDIRKKEDQNDDNDLESAGVLPKQTAGLPFYRRILLMLFSRVFLQAMSMTFLAEWGDRSQLATIVLASRENISAVILAGLLGHSICTGLAVVGGKFIAQKISVKTVTIVGGVVFLVFAATALFLNPDDS